MQDHILLGRGETTSTVSSDIWRQQLAGAPELGEARLSFMTPAHHLVRNTVVCTLPPKRARSAGSTA